MREPIPVRGHMVLCLLGFRGEGYSPTFVDEMAKLWQRLAAEPDQPIQLITAPDPMCQACIHLRRGGCTLGGPDHETHMRAHDEEVLRRLGFEQGAVHPWREVRTRIAARISGSDLPDICTTCPWLKHGWCQKAVDGLRGDQPAQAADV